MSRHIDDQDVQTLRDEFLLAGSPLGDDEYLAALFATLRDVRDLEGTPQPSPALTLLLERGTGAYRAGRSPSLRRILAQRFATASLAVKVMVGAGLVGAGVAAAGGLSTVPGGSFIQDGIDAVTPSGDDGPFGTDQIFEAREFIIGAPGSGPTLVPTVVGQAPAEATPAAVGSSGTTTELVAAQPEATVVLSPGRPVTPLGNPWDDVIDNIPNAGGGNGNHGNAPDWVGGGGSNAGGGGHVPDGAGTPNGGSGYAGGGNAGSDNADAGKGNSSVGGARAEHAYVGDSGTGAANSGAANSNAADAGDNGKAPDSSAGGDGTGTAHSGGKGRG